MWKILRRYQEESIDDKPETLILDKNANKSIMMHQCIDLKSIKNSSVVDKTCHSSIFFSSTINLLQEFIRQYTYSHLKYGNIVPNQVLIRAQHLVYHLKYYKRYDILKFFSCAQTIDSQTIVTIDIIFSYYIYLLQLVNPSYNSAYTAQDESINANIIVFIAICLRISDILMIFFKTDIGYATFIIYNQLIEHDINNSFPYVIYIIFQLIEQLDFNKFPISCYLIAKLIHLLTILDRHQCKENNTEPRKSFITFTTPSKEWMYISTNIIAKRSSFDAKLLSSVLIKAMNISHPMPYHEYTIYLTMINKTLSNAVDYVPLQANHSIFYIFTNSFNALYSYLQSKEGYISLDSYIDIKKYFIHILSIFSEFIYKDIIASSIDIQYNINSYILMVSSMYKFITEFSLTPTGIQFNECNIDLVHQTICFLHKLYSLISTYETKKAYFTYWLFMEVITDTILFLATISTHIGVKKAIVDYRITETSTNNLVELILSNIATENRFKEMNQACTQSITEYRRFSTLYEYKHNLYHSQESTLIEEFSIYYIDINNVVNTTAKSTLTRYIFNICILIVHLVEYKDNFFQCIQQNSNNKSPITNCSELQQMLSFCITKMKEEKCLDLSSEIKLNRLITLI